MEDNKDAIRKVPEVIKSKKHRSLEKWQHKQLKTVCGVNSPQMSDFVRKTTKFKLGESTHSADTTFKKTSQHQKTEKITLS